MWEGVTVVRRCEIPQGGVKVVRNLFQLMDRYDAHWRDVRGCVTVVRNSDGHQVWTGVTFDGKL